MITDLRFLTERAAKEDGVCERRGQVGETGYPLNPAGARHQRERDRDQHRHNRQVFFMKSEVFALFRKARLATNDKMTMLRSAP